MKDVRITSGSSEVLATGTVIQFKGNPITIELEGLKFIIHFIDEKGTDKRMRAESNVPDSLTLDITFFNFDNPLGTGSESPLRVATLSNRQLYFHYRIYHLEEGDKTFQFTFFVEEEVSKDA